MSDEDLGYDYDLGLLVGVPEEQQYYEHAEQRDEHYSPVVEEYGPHKTQYDYEHADIDVHRALLILHGGRMGLLLGHDGLALSRRESPYPGLVEILGIVICHHILEVFLGEILHHGVRQHRLSGTWLADEHHVPLLRSRLLHDLNGHILPDDAIGYLLGNYDILCGFEGLPVDPLLYRLVGRLLFCLVFHLYSP